MDEMDKLIGEYASVLRAIYVDRTMGDFTFQGVLSEFLRKASEVELHEKIKELR